MNYRILIWKLDKRKGEAVAVVTGKLIVGLILSGEVTIHSRGKNERGSERKKREREREEGEGVRESLFAAFLAHVLM